MDRTGTAQDVNKLQAEDRSVHDWYRFVLSFPAHLVREYVAKFGLDASHRLLDPFCGTGTTVVEAKKMGIPSTGIEAHPFSHFAAQVKVNWFPDPCALLAHAEAVAAAALSTLAASGMEDAPFMHENDTTETELRTLDEARYGLLLKNSISPLPLHKTLVLLETLKAHHSDTFSRHEHLASGKCLVSSISNLRFGPEVGVGQIKSDAPVIHPWLEEVKRMASDLAQVRPLAAVPAEVHHADSRQLVEVLTPGSISAVFTSPPYPNEKDYTRTTRLESVVLGFIRTKQELRALKRQLMRSNTRGVYRGDDDDAWISGNERVQSLAGEIEKRRLDMGKTSGFERQYARVTKLYFGGMARHFAQLRPYLKPGAMLGYVVGDQASYLRVMIRTGEILAEIAEGLGYEVVGLDLFRTRMATATREQLREEVVVLRWPGGRT